MEVSAEVHFAQKLASNEKKYRDRALKRLSKFLTIRSTQGDGMSNDDFIKIWKGLHYCMWMQDKPLIQEELSQRVTNLLHSFPRLSDSLRFVNVFFITEAREWPLIDRFRIDKFMMLIRDVLHEIFLIMSESGWPLSACEAFSQYLANSLMNEDNPKLPDGLKLHMADIFMPELRKVSLEKMTGKKMTILMFPFAAFILKTRKLNLASKVVSQTITPALRRFGSWPKQEKAKAETQNSSQDPKPKTEKDDKNEEEDMECEDQDQEEIGEENERSEKKTIQKYDMTRLLKLMFKMADNKKVHHKNRAMFYKIVQRYSSVVGSFLSSESKNVTESKGNGITEENDDEDNASDESSTQTILNLCWPQNLEEPLKKKRKQKKKHFEPEVKLKTDEKGKFVTEVADQQTVASGERPENKPKTCTKSCSDVNFNAPGKKRRRESDLEDSGANLSKRVCLNAPSSPSSSTPLNSKLKEKINQKLHKNIPDLKNFKKSEKGSVSPKDKNYNSASGIEVKEGNLSLFSSMEFVTYTHSDSKVVSNVPKNTSSKSKPSTEMDSTTESNSQSEAEASTTNSTDSLPDSSMSDVKVFTPKSKESRKAAKKKKKTKASAQISPEEFDDSITEEKTGKKKKSKGLVTVLTFPSNLVQKSKAIILPASDPGQNEEKMQKVEGNMTPGTKKKVVFNLRKNRANKFRDYLKSLNSDSSPRFEPKKSPSQSILKSPLPSPSSSSVSVDWETRPKKKGAKRASASGDRKVRRASHSPPMPGKRSPKTVRKTSKSPKKKK